MKSVLFALAALVVFTPACGDEEDPAVDFSSGEFSVEVMSAAQVCSGGPTESVTVTSAGVSDDTLTVGVQFAGGCGSHRFDLCWNGGWSRSDPPQFGLWLVHETEDRCEALLSEALSFDLRPVEEAYYGDGITPGTANELVLRLGDRQLSYAVDGLDSDDAPEEACATGGCNGELCASASVVEELATACVVLPEYACLQDAVCERQSDGRCGWSYSEEALQCLEQID